MVSNLVRSQQPVNHTDRKAKLKRPHINCIKLESKVRGKWGKKQLRCGVRSGLTLIAVNNEKIVNLQYNEIVNMVANSPLPCQLSLAVTAQSASLSVLT
eukprot:UN17013